MPGGYTANVTGTRKLYVGHLCFTCLGRCMTQASKYLSFFFLSLINCQVKIRTPCSFSLSPCIQTHAHAQHTRSSDCAHTENMYTHTNTHTLAHTHKHIHNRMHAHIHTHTHAHTHTHTHAHTCTHTHTYTRTHTHRHTQTLA